MENKYSMASVNMAVEEKSAPVSAPPPENQKFMITKEQADEIVNAIKAIHGGPRVLKLYMDMCARCGTCANVCPIYFGSQEKKYNPSARSDIIRSVFKKNQTISGKLLGSLVGARDFSTDDLEKWVEDSYSCTGCRRCATYCPFGIDNSVITRKIRGILDKAGLTPETMKKVVEISLKTRNTDGASPEAFKAAIAFLEEEMHDEHGIDIRIPVDVVGADYFYVPPSGDVLVNPEATMGLAKVFHVLGM